MHELNTTAPCPFPERLSWISLVTRPNRNQNRGTNVHDTLPMCREHCPTKIPDFFILRMRQLRTNLTLWKPRCPAPNNLHHTRCPNPFQMHHPLPCAMQPNMREQKPTVLVTTVLVTTSGNKCVHGAKRHCLKSMLASPLSANMRPSELVKISAKSWQESRPNCMKPMLANQYLQA